MIDLFRILKLDYKEYVILFKSENFYIAFDEDSIILNKIFNYKIVDLKNNVKIGFPISKLDIIINRLKDMNINYIIVENKSIINKYESEVNNFFKYTSSVFEIISINNKIECIVDKLKKIDREDIYLVLDKIDSIINEY